jgi:hypothetical protein
LSRLLAKPAEPTVTLAFVTPQIIPRDVIAPSPVTKAEPSAVEQRAAKSAAKLVRKYHEACAKGEPEKARKYARQALDFDPACFAERSVAAGPEKMINESEDFRPIRNEWRKVWMNDQPSHLTPERVHGGIQ